MQNFSESKFIKHLNIKVQTPFGEQTIESLHKTKPLPTITFTLECGLEITVARFHTFVVQGQEISAFDLKCTDVLETQFHGLSKIVKISEDETPRELYDLTLDQEEFENFWYYSNGVLSHNSGKSITVACYLAWLFNFNENMNIGIVANRGAQAREFLQNVKDIFVRLPIWLTQGITEWNKGSIASEKKMRILTDVPSIDAFRGFAIHCLVVDECVGFSEIITVKKKKTSKVLTLKIGNFFKKLSKNSNSDVIFSDEWEVLTSNGFKPFFGIKKVQNSGILIRTATNEIQVTKKHKFFENNDFLVAENLKVGDFLGSEKIIEILEKPEISDYFDLLEVRDGHHYTTSGFESSNCAFIRTENWEEFSDAVFPTQGSLSWKKNIIISTAKGLNHFYEIVNRAKMQSKDPDSKTGFVEVHWAEVPRFNPDGSQMEPEDFKRQIIQRYGRVYFEQNYGNSFLGSSETLLLPETMNAFQQSAPDEVLGNAENGINFKIFEQPQKNHTYLMGVDPAKDGKDFFAVQILDLTSFPFRQVACGRFKCNYFEMPDYLYEWGGFYNTAHMIIENNEGAGQSVADILANQYEYPNLYYDQGKLYPGFRTTTKTRDQMLKMFQILGNSHRLNIVDPDTITELQRFEKVNGKFQASSGHDDLVMSFALCLVPIMNLDNINDFAKFLSALKSKEEISTTDFFDIDNFTFADF